MFLWFWLLAHGKTDSSLSPLENHFTFYRFEHNNGVIIIKLNDVNEPNLSNFTIVARVSIFFFSFHIIHSNLIAADLWDIIHSELMYAQIRSDRIETCMERQNGFINDLDSHRRDGKHNKTTTATTTTNSFLRNGRNV